MHPVLDYLKTLEKISQGRESEIFFTYLCENPSTRTAKNFIKVCSENGLEAFEAVRTVESSMNAQGVIMPIEFVADEDYGDMSDYCT